MSNLTNSIEEDKPTTKPGYRLYTTAQIGITCFFATPFTALIMIALNFRAVKDFRSYKQALALAVILLPFLIIFLNFIADKHTYRILIFFIAALMAYIAKIWQGGIYQEHIQKGGERKSIWHVIGVILVGLSIIFVGLIIFGLLK